MAIDVAALRAHFPSLSQGFALFDGPGGAQTPVPVAEAVAATMTGPLSNRGTVSASERNAEQAVAAFRAAHADLLGMQVGRTRRCGRGSRRTTTPSTSCDCSTASPRSPDRPTRGHRSPEHVRFAATHTVHQTCSVRFLESFVFMA
jgi:hypothetical protein